MMKPKKFLTSYTAFAVKIIAVALVLSSCNKDFPNILKEYGEQPNFDSGSSKILYIIADGVRGKALQQLELPNFNVISRNSLYSFGSLGDYQSNPLTKESGLANLLTGVTNGKHMVSGSDLTQINTEEYPSLLSRIRTLNPNLTSAAFTSTAAVSENLFNDANVNELLEDDAAVLAQTKAQLSNENADLVVSHFSAPYVVGSANTFKTDDAAYAASLATFDQQVGELVAAVKARTNFSRENWLIVITSSIGGPVANQVVDNTSYGDNTRNTFTYLYSPKFTRSLLTAPNSSQIPFDGNAVRYRYGTNQTNATLANASKYNFGNATDDFTLNFFIKSNVTTSHNYPIILSKRASGFGGEGWNLFMEVRGELGGTNPIGWNSNISNQMFGTKRINDGSWHSFTVVVHRSGAVDSVKLFTDGEFNVGTTSNQNSLNNTAPLVIGKKVGNDDANADFLISNFQIYNTALTNEEVANLSGITHIAATHPKRANLIGYWPGYSDVGTSRLTDLSGNNNHMLLTGDYSWTSFSDVVSFFQPPITESYYKLVPNAVDVPFFIYQWFGMVPKTSWGLEGKSWTPNLIVTSN